MNYKKIDLSAYKRKSHFEYFCSLAYPYVGVTVNVRMGRLPEVIRERKLPFFLTVCYCVARAANRVPEFRQRIVDGGIVEFDWCRTSHTVALPDETYCYCTLDASMPFEKYLSYAKEAQEAAKQNRFFGENGEEEDLLFVSTTPWFSYTSLVQPVPVPADSHPRLVWGKYFTQEGEVLMPVSVLCHHALVDGLHIARFYEALEEEVRRICLLFMGQESAFTAISV